MTPPKTRYFEQSEDDLAAARATAEQNEDMAAELLAELKELVAAGNRKISDTRDQHNISGRKENRK